MIRHDAFTLTRRFDASPGEVFALFAEEERWRRWFRMPGSNATYGHDFRVGGGDRRRAGREIRARGGDAPIDLESKITVH